MSPTMRPPAEATPERQADPLDLRSWAAGAQLEMLRNLRLAGTGNASTAGSSVPNAPLYLPVVIKPETLEAVSRLDLVAQSIADRWAATWPSEVRRLEGSNLLIGRLAAQAGLEAAVLSDARRAGRNADVPDSDLLELAGVDLDQHLFE